MDENANRRGSSDQIVNQNSTSQRTGEASGSTSQNNVGPQTTIPSSEMGTEAPMTIDEEFPEPICGGCKKMIDEDSADAGVIHFA